MRHGLLVSALLCLAFGGAVGKKSKDHDESHELRKLPLDIAVADEPKTKVMDDGKPVGAFAASAEVKEMFVVDASVGSTDFKFKLEKDDDGSQPVLSRISALSTDNACFPKAHTVSMDQHDGAVEGVFRVVYNCRAKGETTVVVTVSANDYVVSFAWRKSCSEGPLHGFSVVDSKDALVIDNGHVTYNYQHDFLGVRVHPQEAESHFYVQLPPGRPARNFLWTSHSSKPDTVAVSLDGAAIDGAAASPASAAATPALTEAEEAAEKGARLPLIVRYTCLKAGFATVNVTVATYHGCEGAKKGDDCTPSLGEFAFYFVKSCHVGPLPGMRVTAGEFAGDGAIVVEDGEVHQRFRTHSADVTLDANEPVARFIVESPRTPVRLSAVTVFVVEAEKREKDEAKVVKEWLPPGIRKSIGRIFGDSPRGPFEILRPRPRPAFPVADAKDSADAKNGGDDGKANDGKSNDGKAPSDKGFTPAPLKSHAFEDLFKGANPLQDIFKPLSGDFASRFPHHTNFHLPRGRGHAVPPPAPVTRRRLLAPPSLDDVLNDLMGNSKPRGDASPLPSAEGSAVEAPPAPKADPIVEPSLSGSLSRGGPVGPDNPVQELTVLHDCLRSGQATVRVTMLAEETNADGSAIEGVRKRVLSFQYTKTCEVSPGGAEVSLGSAVPHNGHYFAVRGGIATEEFRGRRSGMVVRHADEVSNFYVQLPGTHAFEYQRSVGARPALRMHSDPVSFAAPTVSIHPPIATLDASVLDAPAGAASFKVVPGRARVLRVAYNCVQSGEAQVTATLKRADGTGVTHWSWVKQCAVAPTLGLNVGTSLRDVAGAHPLWDVMSKIPYSAHDVVSDGQPAAAFRPRTHSKLVHDTTASFFFYMRNNDTLPHRAATASSSNAVVAVDVGGGVANGGVIGKHHTTLTLKMTCAGTGSSVITVSLPVTTEDAGEQSEVSTVAFAFTKVCRVDPTDLQLDAKTKKHITFAAASATLVPICACALGAALFVRWVRNNRRRYHRVPSRVASV